MEKIEQSSQQPNKDKQWVNKSVDKFIVLNQELGKGAFGTVYKGFFKDNPEKLVACKAIDIQHITSSQKVLDLIKREVEILQKLHKNKYITCLYDVARTKNNVYMFLEFCQDGNLKEYIKSKNILSENEAILIFRHLCQGFKELQKNDIIHRDVKPENILLHSGSAKLSDFGFARVIETGCEIPGYFSRLGTPFYMAPQILEDSPFSSRCDVWSMGVVLYEMLYGKLPWTGKSQVELLKNIKNKELAFPEEPARSKEIKDLLVRMLKLQEENRITWEQIFQLDIVRNSKPINQLSASSCLIYNQLDISNNMKKENNVQFIDNQENEEYLQQNLVQGYLDSDVNNQKSQNSQLEIDHKTVQKKENLESTEKDMNISQVFQNQVIKQKARKQILKINAFLLHERNISFFFNYVLQLLVKSFNSEILKLDSLLYFKLIFCISKHQNIALQRISATLKAETNETFDKTAWENFLQSREYKKTYDLIRTDQLHCSAFFKQVYEKTKQIVDQSINQDQSQQNETDSESNPEIQKHVQSIQQFQKIMNPKFEFNSTFKEQYKQMINDNLKIIYDKYQILNEKVQQQKEILIIVRYLLVSLNPYKEFLPQTNESFDFNIFYEIIENTSEQALQKFLIEKIENSNNKQQENNKNHSAQGKYPKYIHSKTLKK